MPAPIVIEITPRGRAVIAKLQRFPQDMGQAIKRGMDEAGNIAWRDITLKRFSGKGPFPVAMHKLGERTERLKQSLFYRAATVNTSSQSVVVTGTFGSFGVKYFPVHEYGFSGPVVVNSFFRKNRGGKGNALVATHGSVMNIPARAPMHHGIEDNKINFQTKIQRELEKEWAKRA